MKGVVVASGAFGTELDAGETAELETSSEEDVSRTPTAEESGTIEELETCKLSLDTLSGACVEDESSPHAMSATAKNAHAQDTAKERFIIPNIQ